MEIAWWMHFSQQSISGLLLFSDKLINYGNNLIASVLLLNSDFSEL